MRHRTLTIRPGSPVGVTGGDSVVTSAAPVTVTRAATVPDAAMSNRAAPTVADVTVTVPAAGYCCGPPITAAVPVTVVVTVTVPAAVRRAVVAPVTVVTVVMVPDARAMTPAVPVVPELAMIVPAVGYCCAPAVTVADPVVSNVAGTVPPAVRRAVAAPVVVAVAVTVPLPVWVVPAVPVVLVVAVTVPVATWRAPAVPVVLVDAATVPVAGCRVVAAPVVPVVAATVPVAATRAVVAPVVDVVPATDPDAARRLQLCLQPGTAEQSVPRPWRGAGAGSRHAVATHHANPSEVCVPNVAGAVVVRPVLAVAYRNGVAVKPMLCTVAVPDARDNVGMVVPVNQNPT
jgi:hypothetical protein